MRGNVGLILLPSSSFGEIRGGGGKDKNLRILLLKEIAERIKMMDANQVPAFSTPKLFGTEEAASFF